MRNDHVDKQNNKKTGGSQTAPEMTILIKNKKTTRAGGRQTAQDLFTILINKNDKPEAARLHKE